METIGFAGGCFLLTFGSGCFVLTLGSGVVSAMYR